MGSPNLIPIPSPDDKNGIVRAIRKLASLRLNADSTPTFAELTISGPMTAGSLSLSGTLDMQDNPITNLGYIDFDLSPSVSEQEGRMYWNSDDGTLNLGMPGGTVNLQIGQEMILRGRNTTGSTIVNGSVVRIMGASGNRPLIELADADDVSTGVTGLATEDIDDNSNGYVTIYGAVRDIDTNAYSPGTYLFLSDTAGAYTNVPPSNGKRQAFIGTVIVQGTSNGSILVQPINSPFLGGLSGVTITNVADQDVIQFDSSLNNWVNTNRLNELWDIANGTFLESIDFLVTENAGTVTGSLEQTGGGELTQRFSDGYSNLDTDPALTVDLTAYVGTDAVPKVVYTYILQSDKGTIVANNTGWPATEHIKIADLILQSAVTTGAEGALVNRNWNDHTQGTNSQGHLTHIEERLRKEACHWESGVAMSIKDAAGSALTTGNSSTAIELVTSLGSVYQLHKQTFDATDMYVNADDDVHITNQPVGDGGAFLATHDLVTDIVSIQDGTAIGVNKYFNLVVWGIQNKTGEASHIMVNLPSGQYSVESQATTDADGYSIFTIPAEFKGTGFLIARLTFRLIAGSQWTYIALEDLRGQSPSVSAGVGVSTTDHSLLTNLTADDHTLYHTDARAATWLGSNQSLVDHDQITNNHNLTTDIDHDTLTNFVSNEHIDWTGASANFDTSGTGQFDGNVGIGTSPFAAKSLFVWQAVLDTAVSYAGIHSVHVKSAGASDFADTMYGFQNAWTYNQSGGEIGSLYGVHNTLTHSDGAIGSVANNRHMYGFFSKNDMNAGTVNGTVYGIRFELDQEAAHTVTGDAFGMYLSLDIDGTVTGTSTVLRLIDATGVDFCIFQAGSAPSKLVGALGIGVEALTKLTVEGTITLKEQAAADGDTLGYGQLWIKNTDPCQLWFTDDLGNDTQIV